MKINRLIRIALKYTLIISLLITFNSSAQTSPVQANVITTGPYLNYLSYYGDQNNHLQIVLTNLDFSVTPLVVRLRLRIEGPGWVVYTNPNATIGQPFVLDAGMPLSVTGIELLPYLLESNLINPNGIDLNNIPEGFATVCVDVINESAQQQVLSSNNCGFLPIQQVRPPTPFLPDCGTRIDTITMFENFQWFAPNPPAVGLGVQTMYDLSIYWWQDTTNFSDNAWLYNPIYQEQFIDLGEIFTVPIYELNLVPGQKYVWNVKARVFVDNVEKINATVNNGLSQICHFYYGESMSLAEILSDGLEIELFTSASSARKGKAWWTVTDNTPNQGLSSYDEFFVEFRRQPTGNEGYEIPWFSKTLTSFEHFIYQLEPSTTYEVKVSGVIAGIAGDPTPVQTFTTPDPRVYNCGESDLPYLPSNYTVLENATVGTQVQIGQFTMTMTEVNELGGGHYAGKGTIPVAFLGGAKAKVRFDDILIDTEYRVHQGRADVITQGLDNWLDQQYQQFIDPYYVDGVVDSAWVDTVNGVAWVTVDGVDQQFTFDPPHYPIIVNDENGNQYTIYPDGQIVIGTYLAISETWAANADEVIHFSQNDSELRGFDAKEHMEWHENYEIMMLADSSKYFVANKSLAKNEADLLNVEIPSGASASFQFSDGSPLTANSLQGNYLGNPQHVGSTKMTLSIPAQSNSGNYSIYAMVNNQKVGQLNVKVYSKKDKELVIVPIANAGFTKAQVEAELDQTLGEANIDVNVTIDSVWIDTTGMFTASTNISLPSEVGLLTKYSDDMRDLRDVYFEQHPNAPKDKYYLFLVNGFDDPNEMGYMVRGRSMGFVKTSQQSVLHTISHELGHGMGALEHTWNTNGPAEASTTSLMDYNGGDNLTIAEWKEIRDFDIVPSMFDALEDGSYTLASLDYICIPSDVKLSDETIFIDLDNNKVNISGDYSPYAFVGASSDQAGAVSIVINNSTGVVYYPTNVEGDSGYYGLYDGTLNMQDHYVPQTVSVGDAITLSASSNGGYVLKKGGNITQTGTSTEMRSCPGLPSAADPSPNESEFFEELILPSSQFDALTLLDSATYQARFNTNVDKFVGKLNAVISQRSAGYNYLGEPTTSLNSSKHIVEVANSQYTPYALESVKVGILDQQFAYLQDYSNSKGEKVELYVVAGDVNLLMAGSKWQEFTKAVYENSNLANKNAMLITIPSVHMEEHYTGYYFGTDATLYNVTYRQPSVYGNADFNELGLLSSGPYSQDSIVPFIQAVYKHLSKPVKIHRAFQELDGSISKNVYEPQSFKTGYSFCKAVAVYRKPQHDAFQEEVEETLTIGVYNGIAAMTTGPLDVLNYELKQVTLREAANQSAWVRHETNGDYLKLKENYIDNFADQYVKYAFSSDFQQWAANYYVATSGLSLFTPPPSLNSDYYYTSSTWDVVRPMVYATVDAVGIGLSFVGLDGVTDAVGLAIAAAAGDSDYAASYGTAIALVGVTGGVVHLAVQYGPSLVGKTRMFYKGLTYVLKNGQWKKIGNSPSYGRILSFFKLTDEGLISVSEMDAFITKLDNGDFTHSQISSIISEPTEITRAAKLKQLTGFNLLSSLQSKFAGKPNTWNWITNEVSANTAIINKLDALPVNSIDNFEIDINSLKSTFTTDPDLIDSWKKLSNYPPAVRTNLTNLNQRKILNEYAGNIATASNARKGNFGEIGADLDLNTKGYNSLIPRIDDIDAFGHNGIDGIFEKNGEYFIIEGKYTGSATLNPANEATNLPRQMSDAWIQNDNRLLDALGGNQDLVDDILESGYERVLAKVAPDGSVTYKYVSDIGYLNQGGGPLGNWIP